MKVAIVTDSHCGVRNDSPAFLDQHERFFRDQFFPRIAEAGCEAIVHMGDLLDRRKYVNYKTAEVLRRSFVEPASSYQTWVICGNHDVMHKNTNEINALRELIGDRIETIGIVESSPRRVRFGSMEIGLLPWISGSNRLECLEFIDTTPATVIASHLELAGFKMYRNSIESHGMDASPFSRFDAVLSGHYHHQSSRGNVVYCGAPFEMTWDDAGDERGFWILDTETGSMDRVVNPSGMHVKLHYDEGGDEVSESVEGRVVKLIVRGRADGKKFDDYVRSLENASPADLQVVDDHLHLDVAVGEDDEEVVGVEDTPVVLRRAVADLDSDGVDGPALETLLMDVYREAVSRR